MKNRVEDDPSSSGSALTVIVATYDRAEEVASLLGYLAAQTRMPDEVIVVGADRNHLPPVPKGPPRTRFLVSEAGTCRQRNVGIDALSPRCRYVVFLDDDYVPAPDALEEIVRAFEADDELVGLEGVVLADGVTRGGIAREDAERIVERDLERRRASPGALPGAPERLRRPGLYGCNMAYRMEAVGALRFDEELPRYGWQEDVDFATRIARRGSLARAGNFRGVHRGVFRGRSSGLQTGYSQVANPYYLVRKGTLSGRFALRLVARNLLANHVHAFRPEPWVDRAGRVRGNWMALRDLLRGRLHPRRILEIP